MKSKYFREIFEKYTLSDYLESIVEKDYLEKMESLNYVKKFSVNSQYKVEPSLLVKRGKILKNTLETLIWIYRTLKINGSKKRFKRRKGLYKACTFNNGGNNLQNDLHDLLLEIFLDDLSEAFDNLEYHYTIQNILEIKKPKGIEKRTLYEIDTYFKKSYLRSKQIHTLESIIEVKSSANEGINKEALAQAFKNPFLLDVIEGFSKYLKIKFTKNNLVTPKPDLMLASLYPEDKKQLQICEEVIEKKNWGVKLNYKPKLELNLKFISYSRGLKHFYEYLKETNFF